MAEFHSPCFACQLDDLEECNYPGERCRYHVIWEVTGHGPVVRTTGPSSLLLYRNVFDPNPEPRVSLIESGWPEENMNEYMPNTILQELYDYIDLNDVPVHPMVKMLVDKVLEWLAEPKCTKGANREGGVKELDDVLDALKTKCDDFVSHWRGVLRRGRETGWAPEGDEQVDSAVGSDTTAAASSSMGKGKACKSKSVYSRKAIGRT